MTSHLYTYLTNFLFVCSISSSAQSQTVSFIKAVPEKSFHNTKDSVILYPVFTFRNKALADNINKKVKSDFYENYGKNTSLPVKTVLNSLAKEGLAELSYEEIRNDSRFFSFAIHHEWIAAYPSYNQRYYAFDKKSATHLSIDSLILPRKRKAFRNLVINLWKDSVKNYREDLLAQLTSKEIDSTDYALALEYLRDDCVNSYSPNNFRLNQHSIEVFFECGFPRVMLPLDPSGGIVVSFKTLSGYLQPKYKP